MTMKQKLPIADLGNVLRLDSCAQHKDMCWGYDGFVLVHKDANKNFDSEKPFIAIIDQDGIWQMHFENFEKMQKNEKILDDMYNAIAASCKKGMELQCVGGATPGGISGISKLQNYGFKKVSMPDDTNVYWSEGMMDPAKLEKWLNSGRHNGDFIVKANGKFMHPDKYDGKITMNNTKPKPFKMVKQSDISEVAIARKNLRHKKSTLVAPLDSEYLHEMQDIAERVDNIDRQIYYWAHMLDEAFGPKTCLYMSKQNMDLS